MLDPEQWYSLINYHTKNIFNIFPAAEKETQKTNIQQAQYGIEFLKYEG